MSQYTVSKEAIGRARELGLFGKLEERLARMARLSVPFTHEDGNRRFHDFLLLVEGQRVVSINRFDPSRGRTEIEVKPGKVIKVICPDCENDGGFCLSCNSTGVKILSEAEFSKGDYVVAD